MSQKKSAAKRPKSLRDKVIDNELDMSLMGLTEMPLQDVKSFSNRLSTLDLSNNHIRDLGLEFSTHFRQLLFLDLSKNVLVSLPENIGQMVSLQHLDLYKNKIQRLPLSMAALVKLRWLDVKDNPLVPTLARICGTCSNSTECRACARNVPLFMQHLDKKISAAEMNANEPEDEEQEESQITLSQARLRDPTKVMREVLSPTHERAQFESETDRGTDNEIDDDELPLLTGMNKATRSSIIPQTTTSRRRRGQASNPSFIVDETSVTTIRGSQIKKKRNTATTWNSNIQEITEYSRPILTVAVRIFLYLACLYFAGFTLLALCFDEKFLHDFLFNKIGFPGLGKLILPVHGGFQNWLRFDNFLPLFKSEDEHRVGFLQQMLNLVTFNY